MLNSVVLPDPFGPISPVILPASTVIEQASRARIPPKALATSFASSRLIGLIRPLAGLVSRADRRHQGAGRLRLVPAGGPSEPHLAQRGENALRHQQDDDQE